MYVKLHYFQFAKELWPKQNYTQFIRIFMGPHKARVQNGMSDGCIDVVFELVIHKESEIWTSVSHSFTKAGLLQLPG